MIELRDSGNIHLPYLSRKGNIFPTHRPCLHIWPKDKLLKWKYDKNYTWNYFTML